MRVIAGAAGGVRLAPVPRGVRPVSDMAREGVFSSLGGAVSGARVLDLYAGVGALGVEALSRGAERAVFVERNRAARSAIQENLRRIGAQDRGAVVASDVRGYLGGPERDPFDLVLADPPYATSNAEVEETLEGLRGGWLASQGWRVVLFRPSRLEEPPAPPGWDLGRRLTYGDTRVAVFRPAAETAPEG
jgi:16S rRNA (guanine966-N2)-methyltransferase